MGNPLESGRKSTEKPNWDNTTVSLHEHLIQNLAAMKELFETRLDETVRNLNQRIDTIDTATTLAAVQMEKRLEGMNEFRAALKDQVAQYVTRAEYDADKKAGSAATMEREERTDADIRMLRESKATLEGKASQKSVTVVLAISIVGVILSVIGILIRIAPIAALF